MIFSALYKQPPHSFVGSKKQIMNYFYLIANDGYYCQFLKDKCENICFFDKAFYICTQKSHRQNYYS